MPIRRMNREEFFGRLATLDEQRLKKALWNLYWRGSAAMRERIEAEIDPDQHGHSRHSSKEPADPEQLLAEVRDFVALVRSGAYMAGDRRVSPRERSRWRLTFKRLVGDAQESLRAQDAAVAATTLGSPTATLPRSTASPALPRPGPTASGTPRAASVTGGPGIWPSGTACWWSG